MEIKIGDRVFYFPDACPTDAPNKRRLTRHLRDHGPESLLASKMLSPYAGCVVDEILKAGGQPVEPSGEPQVIAAAPGLAQEAAPETEDKPAETAPKA